MTNGKVTNVKDQGIIDHKRAYLCETDNGSFNFRFYDDELSFTTDELVGLTEDECWALFTKRDIGYLQS